MHRISLRVFLLFGVRRIQPLLHAECNHFPEQFPGHGLIVGQMQGAFGVGQLAEAVRKGVDCFLARMEAHMLLLRGEVDKVALQHKSGDAPGDLLRNAPMAAVNQRPEGNHPFFDFALIGGDVCVNVCYGNPSFQWGYGAIPSVRQIGICCSDKPKWSICFT